MKSKSFQNSNLPAFAKEADNVYRTKSFIVKQNLTLEKQSNGDNCIVSNDTYYRRTPNRDKQYECIFHSRKRINGYRLPCTMFIRKYVDK